MLTYIRIFCLFLLAFSSLAQSKSLNYQAVILNPNPIDVPGNTISNLPYGSSDVCIKFSLQDKNDQLEYQEVHCTKTDSYGLVNLNIGTGNPTATQSMSTASKFSKFDTIIWDANPKKLKVDVSFDQGKSFTQVSSQTLNYAAYALYAESVDYQNVRSAPTKLSQFTDDIQIVSKRELDPIKTDILKNTQGIQSILSSNSQTSTQVAVINQSIVAINKVNETQTSRLDYLNAQVGETNMSIQSLGLTYERLQNRSLDTELGGRNPQDGFYPSQRAVKTYIDAQTTVPATNSIAGKITLAGDLAGPYYAPTVPALTLKENLANKAVAANLGASAPSDVLYPSQKAVKTYIDAQTTPEATTLIQGKLQLAGDLAGSASAPTVPALALKENLSNKAVAANLGASAPSDELYPSQKAVKTYVDAQTTPNATASQLGKVQLAGDLTGTATLPRLAANSVKYSNLADSTVTTSKIVDANVTDAKIVSLQASKLTGNISVANGGTGVSTLTGLVRGNGTGAFSAASYGSFYDLTNQTAALADSAVAMKLSNTDFAAGVTVQNNTQLRFTNAGVYNIQFSAQVDRSAGTTVQAIKIWLRKNGVDIPATSTEMIISGGVSTAAQVASWNFFQNLAAADQVELMWSVSSPQIYIAYTPATSIPRRPAIPSLIVTVNQVY
jgi:hypothetical protein